jgi:glycine cleavage system aminomethyltransferase T
MNFERANYFLPAGAAPPLPTFGTPRWLPHVLAEQRACREDVVVFDQTSFAKFVLKGRDAVHVLQRLAANDVDIAPGRMVYTALLNERGGFESDLTTLRIAPSHSDSIGPAGGAAPRRGCTTPSTTAAKARPIAIPITRRGEAFMSQSAGPRGRGARPAAPAPPRIRSSPAS